MPYLIAATVALILWVIYLLEINSLQRIELFTLHKRIAELEENENSS